MHTMLSARQLKLKKGRKNINLTDQAMWSSVLRRKAYIKYCTHANNLELGTAQHNTYLTCLTCNKLPWSHIDWTIPWWFLYLETAFDNCCIATDNCYTKAVNWHCAIANILFHTLWICSVRWYVEPRAALSLEEFSIHYPSIWKSDHRGASTAKPACHSGRHPEKHILMPKYDLIELVRRNRKEAICCLVTMLKE